MKSAVLRTHQGTRVLGFGLLFISSLGYSQSVLPIFHEPVRITVSETDSVLSRNVHGNLAFGKDGSLHLIYTELNEEGTGSGLPGTLLYQVRRDGVWSDALAVRSEVGERVPLNSGGNPALYPAPDGTVHSVWHDFRNSTSALGTNNVDVYYRRLLSNGQFEGLEQQITSHEGNQWRPKIRGLSSTQLAIGWYDFFQDSGPDMLVTFPDEKGDFNTAEPFELRWVQGAEGVVVPDFSYDSQGRLHIVWTTGFTDAEADLSYGVFASPPSRELSESQVVSKNGGSFGDPPKVYTDGDDHVWMVWTERDNGIHHNIRIAKKPAGASMFDEPVAITHFSSANVVARADMAIDASGKVYVVWTDRRDSEGDLFLRVYDPVSDQLSEEVRLTEEILTTDNQPSIEISPDGEIVIVWQSERDGNIELYMLSAPIESSVEKWVQYE